MPRLVIVCGVSDLDFSRGAVLPGELRHLRDRFGGGALLFGDQGSKIVDHASAGRARIAATMPALHGVRADAQKLGGLPVREAGELDEQRCWGHFQTISVAAPVMRPVARMSEGRLRDRANRPVRALKM